jgi:hypothetical protein
VAAGKCKACGHSWAWNENGGHHCISLGDYLSPHGLTANDIAVRSEQPRTTIYNYYANRRPMLDMLVLCMLQEKKVREL